MGYNAVGIDPSLGAVAAAKRVARELYSSANYAVGDGRFLPFPDRSFDVVFSYSTLQHLSFVNMKRVLSEIKRVLKPSGRSLIQMANKFGLRCLYHQAKRGFREARNFEVRYWRIGDLKKVFQEAIGPTRLFVDCYFGLGFQKSDIPILPPLPNLVGHLSEWLKSVNKQFPFMTAVADSLFVESYAKGQ
jgi:ubiquinone/menaquinone biosynthesis C-methylase UbiE